MYTVSLTQFLVKVLTDYINTRKNLKGDDCLFVNGMSEKFTRYRDYM